MRKRCAFAFTFIAIGKVGVATVGYYLATNKQHPWSGLHPSGTYVPSGMTTFGIPMKRTAASQIGESDACKHIMHDRVVMVINDEISFSPQCHLAVRSKHWVRGLR